ncbi:MAG: aldehyde dehydrogenase family protein [Chloroflexaceae bacterium]|nr:aldehyde dehydrogenase family protein [Chloroflexaceae bacterium]
MLTPFGLTGGIHSLDDREVRYWREHIQVGNAYINRHITGAIVQRQPFGGWKGSVFGPGAKAGGPNYVLQLMHWYQETLPQQQAAPTADVARLLEHCQSLVPTAGQALLYASAGNYAHALQQHFGYEHDPSQVYGEANIFRYRPCDGVLLRAGSDVAPETICQVVLAAATCGVPLTVSLTPEADPIWSRLATDNGVAVLFEDEMQLITRLQTANPYERMRAPGRLSLAVRRAAQFATLAVIDAPVLANGRLELRYYMREQAIAQTLHRYGNILPPPHEQQANGS